MSARSTDSGVDRRGQRPHSSSDPSEKWLRIIACPRPLTQSGVVGEDVAYPEDSRRREKWVAQFPDLAKRVPGRPKSGDRIEAPHPKGMFAGNPGSLNAVLPRTEALGNAFQYRQGILDLDSEI